MLISWICRNCHKHVRLVVRVDDPRVIALTAQAGDDIIEFDQEGNLVVHLLCEDCLEAAYPEDDSKIDFLHEPLLH